MAIYVTARFQVKAEARARCEQAVHEFVEAVKDGPHTRLLYTSVQETGDATRFLHFFIFEDETARDAHSSSAAGTHAHGIIAVKSAWHSLSQVTS